MRFHKTKNAIWISDKNCRIVVLYGFITNELLIDETAKFKWIHKVIWRFLNEKNKMLTMWKRTF